MEKNSRNSPLRELSERVLHPIAKYLYELGIEPNQVTLAGTALTGLGGFLKLQERNLGINANYPALGLLIAGLICDGLDGVLARYSKKSSVDGAIFDLVNDRLQESTLACYRAIMAMERGDLGGLLFSIITGLTNPLPSYFRALVEENGSIVKESGENPISFLGTRGGRTPLAILATIFPDVVISGNNSIQGFLDFVISGGNIISSIERIKNLIETKEIENMGGVKFIHLTEDKAPEGKLEELQELGRRKKETLGKFITINSFVFISLGMIGGINLIEKYFLNK